MAYTNIEHHDGAMTSVIGNAYYSLIRRIMMVGAVTSE
jgi:hypothetical protein